MPAHTEPVRRLSAAVAGLVLCLAVGLTGCAGDPDPRPNQPPPEATARATADAPASSRPREPAPAVADPVAVRMPQPRIEARLQPLALDAEGVLVPPAYGMAGWYAAGPEPGEPGPAVIAGHVDSQVGADVFAALGQARAGHRVLVELEDGTTVAFRVTDVEQFAQDAFPTRRVYGATENPDLRLITCGCDYDHTAGRYQDNVVVFAELAR